MHFVIAYDISHDRRRARLFKTLKDFGAHVEESVFELEIDEMRYAALRHRMNKLLQEGDVIAFWPLCETCRAKVERIGFSPPLALESGEPVVI